MVTQTELLSFVEPWFKFKLKFWLLRFHDEPANFIFMFAIKTEHPVHITKENWREFVGATLSGRGAVGASYQVHTKKRQIHTWKKSTIILFW